MKHFRRAIILFLLLSILPLSAFATTNEGVSKNIVYYDDGSYTVITLSVIEIRAASGKVGTKTAAHYSNDGELAWEVTLSATFKFDGITSSCSSSSCSIEITNTNWYEISKSATKSGNTAYANATLGYKWLGIKVNEQDVSLSLTCDKNGNLS